MDAIPYSTARAKLAETMDRVCNKLRTQNFVLNIGCRPGAPFFDNAVMRPAHRLLFGGFECTLWC